VSFVDGRRPVVNDLFLAEFPKVMLGFGNSGKRDDGVIVPQQPAEGTSEMAKRVIHELVDDLDGKPADESITSR
jgi:hypothetical protein